MLDLFSRSAVRNIKLRQKTISLLPTQNNLSGNLRSEELAVENVIRSLPTVQQPLRRLGGRGGGRPLGLRLRDVGHGLRPQDGGGVETDVFLLSLIQRHFRVINLNEILFKLSF